MDESLNTAVAILRDEAAAYSPEARIVLDMAAVVLHEASDTELHRLARKIERELKRRKAARS